MTPRRVTRMLSLSLVEEGRVELVELGDVQLTYTALHSIDYGPDGQLYGRWKVT